MLSAKSQSPASTLLWQFSVQNRMLLVALVSLFVLPVLVILFQSSRDDMAMVAIPAWLIVSWLGASVFQSDSVHQRVKFLAERGVAPRTIWWTRQILPLGLILFATAVSAILGMAILYGNKPHGSYVSYGNYVMLPWMMLGGPAVLLAHAAAQWQGQLVRSTIVSLIIAPAITLAAIGYAGFAMVTLGAPYWMVFVPSVVAFIATRVMTGPWMDGRTGKKYWLGHGLFLVAALSIPALPFLVTAVLYPGMPNSGYQTFAAELNKYGRTLMDKAGRKEARRRAIVQSWSQLEFSELTASSSSGLAGLRSNVADIRRISRAYWLQLQYLESKDPSEADIRFTEVASAWGLPANRNRQGGLSRETGVEIPGQNWFGDWENFSLDQQGK